MSIQSAGLSPYYLKLATLCFCVLPLASPSMGQSLNVERPHEENLETSVVDKEPADDDSIRANAAKLACEGDLEKALLHCEHFAERRAIRFGRKKRDLDVVNTMANALLVMVHHGFGGLTQGIAQLELRHRKARYEDLSESSAADLVIGQLYECVAGGQSMALYHFQRAVEQAPDSDEARLALSRMRAKMAQEQEWKRCNKGNK